MIRHFFGVLAKENLLGFLLVCATTVGIAIQAFLQEPFESVRLLPIVLPLIYMFVHLRNVVRLARQTFRAIPVPYSVCLGQTHDWFEAAARQQEQKLTSRGLVWGDIQRTYRLHRMDWAFFDPDRIGLDNRGWTEKIHEVARHFGHLANRIPIQPVYHLFLAVPGAFALALGAKCGRRVPVVVYQHAGMVKDPYVPIFDTENVNSREGYHLLNQRISPFKLIEIELASELSEATTRNKLVVLDFTGHELRRPYPQCNANQVLRVRLRGSYGHIPLDGDWGSIAHEIASFLFSLLDDDVQIHLLPGIPASLAFVLGSIVGTTHGLWIYHFNMHESAYTEPFALHAL